MQQPSKSHREKLQRIAEQYGVGERTVYRWVEKGCDPDDPRSIAEHASVAEARSRGISRQKARERLSRSANEFAGGVDRSECPANEQNGDSGAFDSEMESLPPAGEEGAAAALKRLQWFEMQFARRLEKALQLNKANVIQAARDDHIKVAESLRRYEREVEESARDLGHLIPKDEAMRGARSAAIWFRLAWRMWLSSSLPEVLALASDSRDAKEKCEATFSAILSVALKNAEDASFTMPEWAAGVIKEEFRCE